jgi:hypothetical protein
MVDGASPSAPLQRGDGCDTPDGQRMEDDTQTRFAALWQAQRLATLEGSVALDATVTARTLAAAEARAEGQRVSSVEVPPLPTISLDRTTRDSAETPVAPDADLQLLQTLGEGGMGMVYLARQRSLAREVAVKVLRHDDATASDDLLREALITGGIEHPNIVPVHALGRDAGGRPVLVMKRIEGTSWRTLLHDDAHPAWTPLLAAHGDRLSAHLAVLQRVAEAAHFAHTRGVVHRDIKPDNVMVGAFGEVYLVDWGVALRLSQRDVQDGPAAVRGTPAYMAPEMVEGDPARVDARTDVYLLGATLHEVLTRSPRHVQPNLHATLFAAFLSRPVVYGPEVAEALGALCNDATHPDPAQRPQSAQAFRRRVADYLTHRASLTLCDTAQSRLDALVAALAADTVDDVAVRRLATEGRYGFAQALLVWPENTRAQTGLQRVLGCLLRHELARENLDAARALVAELDAPDPTVAAQLAALEDTLQQRRARAEAALHEARERDLSLGSRARLPLMLGTALAVTGAHLLASLRTPGAITLARMTTQHAVVTAVAFAVVAVWRRRLLVNRITRQFVGVLALNLAATLLHRVLVLASGDAVRVSTVVLSDLAILTAVSLVAAIAVRRWFASLAVCALAGAGLTLLDPARATRWFTLSANLMLLGALYYGWVRARSEGQPGATDP